MSKPSKFKVGDRVVSRSDYKDAWHYGKAGVVFAVTDTSVIVEFEDAGVHGHDAGVHDGSRSRWNFYTDTCEPCDGYDDRISCLKKEKAVRNRKFKVGDVVRLTKGAHEVYGVGFEGEGIVEKDDLGDSIPYRVQFPGDWSWFDAEQLEMVKKAKAPKAPKAPKASQEYRGNGKHEWEDVTKGTQRLRVPGGWVYGCGVDLGDTSNFGMVFVPMPDVVKHKV
jgi:thiol-disulfide isomerase/thioredoxin